MTGFHSRETASILDESLDAERTWHMCQVRRLRLELMSGYSPNRAYSSSITLSSSFLKSGAGSRSACPSGSSLFAQACTACPEQRRRERSECVATSSFPSLAPSRCSGLRLRTWLLRSTKSSQRDPSATLRAGFGVTGLGGGGGQVESQRVGIVLAQEVEHLHESAPALAQLRSLKVEIFSDTGCKSVICLLCPAIHVLVDTRTETLGCDRTAHPLTRYRHKTRPSIIGGKIAWKGRPATRLVGPSPSGRGILIQHSSRYG